MTHAEEEAARGRPDGARTQHAWTAGLARLAEELEAFTERLIEAERVLSSPPGAERRPWPPLSPPPSRESSHPPRAVPRGPSPLRRRLDATERLVAHLEDARRRDSATRVLALSDAARRLEHAQRVIELSQRRLASAADPTLAHVEELREAPPPPSSAQPTTDDALSSDLLQRAERAVARVEEFEAQMGDWEDELSRQAELLERVAQSCQELEADLATRDEIELHIAKLIERLSRSIARAPVR